MNMHTPGPWAIGGVFDNDGAPEIIIEHMTSRGNLVVAVALGGLQGQEANAKLIAAAPDLLEALQAFVDHGTCADDVDWSKARAAIAKAAS